MTQKTKKSFGIATAALLLSTGLGATAAIADSQAEMVRVTDFKGSPPFKRTLVPVEKAAQQAEYKRTRGNRYADLTAGEPVQLVDFRGAPPFNRRTVTLDATEVVEFARFEEVSEVSDERRTRRGPPGKMTSRR